MQTRSMVLDADNLRNGLKKMRKWSATVADLTSGAHGIGKNSEESG